MYPERVAKALQRAQVNLNAGDVVSAMVDLQKAVQKYPKGFQCWLLYGQAKGRLGDHVGAEQCFKKAIAILPKDLNGWNCLGLSYSSRGMYKQAANAFSKAVACEPLPHPDIYHNLGSALLEMGQCQEAATVYEMTVPRKDTSDVWALLAMCYKGLDRYRDALAANLKAVERGARGYTINLNLSSCYSVLKDFENAALHAQAALDVKPGDDVALFNLGLALVEAGHAIEGLNTLANSALPQACTARLLTEQYVYPIDPLAIREKHEAITDTQVNGIDPRNITRRLAPGAALRVGFVSGDLREHPVAFFVEGLLSRLDRTRLEVYVYSQVHKPDATTERFKAMGYQWRETCELDDDDFAQVVDQDELHILVDLVGHTVGSRITAYARRLAPVQATYLGYSGTTGLREMDYLLSDTVLVPTKETEAHYSEQVIRIGPVLATYTPPQTSIPVSPLPMDSNGYPTFGSFAQRKKMSPETIQMWIAVLQRVEGAKLMVMSQGLAAPAAREAFFKPFDDSGINRERLILRGPGSMEEYLEAHSQVDVILDTMPWNGHTTTLHALWMGVPTLTTEGVHHASRIGESVARSIGLDRFVVRSTAASGIQPLAEDFAQRAKEIIVDIGKLRAEREGMRDRLLQSQLFDHDGIARRFEAACFTMWEASARALSDEQWEPQATLTKFGLNKAEVMLYPDLARAMSLAGSGEIDQALKTAKRFSEANPTLSIGHIVESDIAEQGGHHSVVLSSCRRAVDIDPDRVDVYFRGILASLRLGDEQAAASFFAEVTPRVLEKSQRVDQLWTLYQYAGQAFSPTVVPKDDLAALLSSPSPLVSVIVPTAGRADLLPHAVQSLLSQSYQNWEAIIVNARAEPLTLATADARLKIIETGSMLTAAQARNRGLEAMQGELFCFLDDDDLFKPQHLSQAVAILRGSKFAGVFSDSDMVNERVANGTRIVVKTNPVQPGRAHSPYLMELRNYISFNELVFRRDCCGGLRFDTALDLWEDWDYMLDAFATGPFGRLHASTVEVRRRPSGQSDHLSHKTESVAACCDYIFNKRPGTREWIDLGRQVFKRVQQIV